MERAAGNSLVGVVLYDVAQRMDIPIHDLYFSAHDQLAADECNQIVIRCQDCHHTRPSVTQLYEMHAHLLIVGYIYYHQI